jgi:two-component system nitrogen regulation response regulator GlnG
MARLLLIDDDPSDVFPLPAHQIEIARTGAEGLKCARDVCPDVILLRLQLPDQSGLDVLRRLREFDARIPVVLITVIRSADAAIEAMRHGAFDYLLRPLDVQQLDRVIGEALKVAHFMREPAVVVGTPREDDQTCDGIVGACPAMQEMCKAIGLVADHTFPVLITGESGTGKELVARAIYHRGPRVKAPFVALNCAAIPETLLESELFGHEKGAFTGAEHRRIGKFEQVSGGTLLLDEIGDMPPSVQAKLLRILQEQTFERLGGSETVRTDVRVIAATNRDLKAWSDEGKFRPDLYYRLAVFSIHLPPLRERGEDLALLVQFHLLRVSRELGRDVREVSPEALKRLRSYSWPGNVRELQSVLKQAILRAHGPVLLLDFLPELMEAPSQVGAPMTRANSGLDPDAFIRERLSPDCRHLYGEAHRELDRVLLTRVLHYTSGNQLRAAHLLGISRRTLRQKLQYVGLRVAHSVEAAQMT